MDPVFHRLLLLLFGCLRSSDSMTTSRGEWYFKEQQFFILTNGSVRLCILSSISGRSSGRYGTRCRSLCGGVVCRPVELVLTFSVSCFLCFCRFWLRLLLGSWQVREGDLTTTARDGEPGQAGHNTGRHHRSGRFERSLLQIAFLSLWEGKFANPSLL